MMQWAALAVTVLLLQGHSVTELPSQPAPAEINPAKSAYYSKMLFANFVWYYDADFLNPVGVTSSVTNEVRRLRLTYPGYVFDSAPGIGMYKYEYGDHPYLLDAFIYSNM